MSVETKIHAALTDLMQQGAIQGHALKHGCDGARVWIVVLRSGERQGFGTYEIKAWIKGVREGLGVTGVLAR